MRKWISTLAVLLTFGVAEVSAAPFTVTLASDGIPGDFAVTADGTRVVVGQSALGDGVPRMWIYAPDGSTSTVDIAMPANVSVSGAAAISPNGRYVAITGIEDGQGKIFVYDRDSDTLDRRGPVASGPTSLAYQAGSIDDSGDVYGLIGFDPGKVNAANDSSTFFSPLGVGFVTDVSGNGVGVGWVSDFSLELQAAMWGADGSYTDLSFGASTSVARGISPDGNTVVGQRDGLMTYWDLVNGSFTSLPFYGELLGVTNDGFMTGYQDGLQSEEPLAFALGWVQPMEFNNWLETLGMVPATTALRIAGCVDRGPTVDCAYQGSVGVALNLPDPTYRDDGGGSTPVPEPATLTLFGLGLLGAAKLRRRAAR